MNGGGGNSASRPLFSPSTSVNGGDFLLQLLQNPHDDNGLHHHHNPPPPTVAQALPDYDPAVAAVGPTIPFTPSPWSHSSPLFAPPNFFHQGFYQNPNPNPNSIPNFSSPPLIPGGFNQVQQHNIPFGFGSFSNLNSTNELEQNLLFGSLHRDIRSDSSLVTDHFSTDLVGRVGNFGQRDRESSLEGLRRLNGVEEDKLENVISLGQMQRESFGGLRGFEQQINTSGCGGGLGWGRQFHSGNDIGSVPQPGFPSMPMSGDFERNMVKAKSNFVDLNHEYEGGSTYIPQNCKNYAVVSDDRGICHQLNSPGPPTGSNLLSVLASNVEDLTSELHNENAEGVEETGTGLRNKLGRSSTQGQSKLHDPEERHVSALGLENESDERGDKKKHHKSRDKDYRSDKRGEFILNQRMRMLKRYIACRNDINGMNAAFLEIYESLVPAEEEKSKQKQVLALLGKIVCKEWPNAQLYVYGSCANSFGFTKSDIDICLTIEDLNIDKSKVLLKLANLLQLENLQNVQALMHARVPIVKLMEPETGISCDICMNNVLAVVNTKLLRDYAQLDVRLRQLAFIVKHWAKCRGVNETFRGTLSSYAYVLMCIHFLQQRRPAILPCLQDMEATYSVSVDNIECAYFDTVEKLHGFGSNNGESLARLVWAFFNYWAYYHDYATDVISIRTGSVLSKRSKDWTKRIGKDRHLICIEDPFEVSHDLGRVVDKYSIRVLREEFERAAEIMQSDPNPCMKLFEPYIPT